MSMSDTPDSEKFEASNNMPSLRDRNGGDHGTNADDAIHTTEPPANVIRVHPHRVAGASEASSPAIAVVCGGDGFQHFAAIEGGQAVARALRHLGCRVVTITVSPRLAAELAESGASTVVPAVLDSRLADGLLPDLCGDLGLVCVGASAGAMRACSDKVLVSARLNAGGIAVPEQRLFTRSAVMSAGLGAVLPSVVAHLGEQTYVKPRYGRGGAGVKLVTSIKAAAPGIVNAFNHGEDLVLERRVEGHELTVLMTGHAAEPLAVGIAEVKYTSQDALAASWARHYGPADSLDASDRWAAVSTAQRAGLTLGLDGLYTVDMIVTADGTPTVIDIDGMLDWRPTSAVGACLRSSEITFPQLFAGLLRDAGATMRRAA